MVKRYLSWERRRHGIREKETKGINKKKASIIDIYTEWRRKQLAPLQSSQYNAESAISP